MDGIKIEVTGNILKVAERPKRITSGTVGLPVEFVFDETWDGMTKTAVFRAGCHERLAKIVEEKSTVPWEILENEHFMLAIGVYGVNDDGTVAIPTIWANVGIIHEGASLEGDVTNKPSLPIWKELENDIGNLFNLKTKAKSNLVEAINEVYAEMNGIETDDYYHTEREEIGVSHNEINDEYVFGLYRALKEEYPDNVREIEYKSNDGTFTAYVYEISTGEYNTAGSYALEYDMDKHIKKPKYLVLNAFHGNERKTVFSTYRFIRDVLKGHNVPQAFREGAIIQVLPVANPLGFNAFSYTKPNGVDISINFDWNWVKRTSSGDKAASEPETQAITKWLTENSDAQVFIDYHNSGATEENVALIGSDTDDTERVKRAALRGIDKVILYWRDVIGYPPVLVPTIVNDKITEDRVLAEVIFSYSVSGDGRGFAYSYANHVLGIPSFAMETAAYKGDYDEYIANQETYPAEPIAMGADALGNILIQLFNEASEVTDMKGVSGKLDTLMEIVNRSLSFRIESGTMTVTEDVLPEDGQYQIFVHLRDGDFHTGKPCSSGAKTFVFYPDNATLTAIENMYKQVTDTWTPPNYTCAVHGNCFEPSVTNASGDIMSYMSMLQYVPTMASQRKGWWVYDYSTIADNKSGANFAAYALKAGTYHWTAYYWDEIPEWQGGTY